MRWSRFLAGSAVAVAVMSYAQQPHGMPRTQAEMHAQVEALYSFHPAKLTSVERSRKSAEMDYFWNEMKSNPEESLPLLRTELRATPVGSFFLTDGSELLLSLSRGKEDMQLAADALARTDLADTQSGTYFYAIHRLAGEGADVTAAALHLLDEPRFLVSVPQHAMTLDLSQSLMYVLLSMKGDGWVGAARRRFAVEKNAKARLALVEAFSYAQTDEADAELRRIAADDTCAEEIRKVARDSLAEAQRPFQGGKQFKGTLAEIREQRRQRLQSVSDEALFDVQWMTRKIAELRRKGAR